MLRRRFALLLVVLCAAPLAFIAQSARPQTGVSPANKEKPHPIDAFYDACVEKNPSTMGMTDCATKAEMMWDKQMNKDYAALLQSSNAKTKPKLREAQRAWIAYRDKEWAAQDAIYDRSGTMWIPARAYAHMRVVKERARQVSDYKSDDEPR